MSKVTPCDVCGNVELNWDRDWTVSDEEWLQVVPEKWQDSVLCPWCFKKFALEHGKQYNIVFYDGIAVGVKRVEAEMSESNPELAEAIRKLKEGAEALGKRLETIKAKFAKFVGRD